MKKTSRSLKVTSTYPCYDKEFDSDALGVCLTVDGESVLSGDWYHDKIDEMIDGFVSCLRYLNIPFEVEEERLNEKCYPGCECEDSVEDGSEEDDE